MKAENNEPKNREYGAPVNAADALSPVICEFYELLSNDAKEHNSRVRGRTRPFATASLPT